MTQFRLHVTDGQTQKTVTVDRSPFTIGRRTTADFQVFNTDVSRDHAELTIDGDGCVLRDRGSRFGTFVNDTRITEHSLQDGDVIRLGPRDGVQLEFRVGEADGESALSRSSDVSDLAQMAAILDGLRALGSGRVLEEVLTLVIDSALDATRAERGFIMLDNQGALEFKVARGRGRVNLPGTSFTTSEKIPRRVFESGASQMVADLLDGNLGEGGVLALGFTNALYADVDGVPGFKGPRQP